MASPPKLRLVPPPPPELTAADYAAAEAEARSVAGAQSSAAGLHNAVWKITARPGWGIAPPNVTYLLTDYDVGAGPPLAAEERLPYLGRVRALTPDHFHGGVSRALTALFLAIQAQHNDRVAPLLGVADPTTKQTSSVSVARGIYERRLPELVAEVAPFKAPTTAARRGRTRAPKDNPASSLARSAAAVKTAIRAFR